MWWNALMYPPLCQPEEIIGRECAMLIDFYKSKSHKTQNLSNYYLSEHGRVYLWCDLIPRDPLPEVR